MIFFKQYTINENDLRISYITYNNIPNDLIDKIYEYSKSNSHTKERFNDILFGANIAFENQELLGRKLPLNDDKCIKLTNYMIKLGISIQYHPNHGMIMVETNK